MGKRLLKVILLIVAILFVASCQAPTAPAPTPAPPPVVYPIAPLDALLERAEAIWHFDQGTGGDEKGRNTAILHDTQLVAGGYEGALQFNGMTSWLETPLNFKETP